MFVLTCKYLKPLYIYVKDLRHRKIPNVDKKVDSAFLFSVVITAIVIIIGIIMEGYVAGGICITVPHGMIMGIMGIFSILQFTCVCCKLCCIRCKKQSTETAQNQLTEQYKLCCIPCCHHKKQSTGTDLRIEHTETAQNQRTEHTETSLTHQLTDYTVLQDKVTLKIAEVVDTGVCFKDRNNEDVTVVGSDGTASLEANLQYAHQHSPAAFTIESQKKVMLKIFGEANENVGITFKDTNNVTCVFNVGFDGTANLECTIECAQDSQQPHFTGCTVLQDMITLKIAGPANKNIDVSFKEANNKVSTVRVNCVIGSDGTATLVGNFQRPHFTGCTVSQGKITLDIAGPANKKFDVFFKDTNNEVSIVKYIIDPDGKATLEGNFQQTNYSTKFPISCHCSPRCEKNCACTSTVCTCTCGCIWTYITKTFILCLLYCLPHVVFYFLTLLVFNFLLHPLSYSVILEYLTYSVVLWIINGVSLAWLFTCCFTCCCNDKRTCTEKIKSRCNMICMSILTFLAASTANLIYIFGWNIVNTFFYDERPQTSDILRSIPVIVTSLLGWYSRDHLLKIFTKLLPKQLPPSAENQLPTTTRCLLTKCLSLLRSSLTRCLSSLTRYLQPTRRRDYEKINEDVICLVK